MSPLYGLDHCKEGQNFSDWGSESTCGPNSLYDSHPEKQISVLREHKEIVVGIRICQIWLSASSQVKLNS